MIILSSTSFTVLVFLLEQLSLVEELEAVNGAKARHQQHHGESGQPHFQKT